MKLAVLVVNREQINAVAKATTRTVSIVESGFHDEYKIGATVPVIVKGVGCRGNLRIADVIYRKLNDTTEVVVQARIYEIYESAANGIYAIYQNSVSASDDDTAYNDPDDTIIPGLGGRYNKFKF